MEQLLTRVEDESRYLQIVEEATFKAFEMYVLAYMRADLEAAHHISAALVGRGVVQVSWVMVINQAMVHLGGPVFSAYSAASGQQVSIFPPPNPPAAGPSTQVAAHATYTSHLPTAWGHVLTVQAAPTNDQNLRQLHVGHMRSRKWDIAGPGRPDV